MQKIIHYLLAAIFIPQINYAQSNWNGGGNDGLWRNPLNWVAGRAPIEEPADNILLDNSWYPDSYTIHITEADSIIIHSLTIAPAEGRTITLVIDTSSSRSIALTVTSDKGGIVLFERGALVNASGASDGVVISIADSLHINNGGMYSHRTRRAHAALVNRLSGSTGTEKGVFEFNIPSASNTLSLSNQVYGTLRLSGREYGRNTTYSGGAANPLYVRGDLELEAGVSFSLNFSDTIFIKGNYLQTGGSLNVANSTRSSVVAFYGDVIQTAGAITKTGSALPKLLFAGDGVQQLRMADGITADIIVEINGNGGVHLLSALVIPYQLDLRNGKLHTSSVNLLILNNKATIKADTTSNTAFVDGPIKKEGLAGNNYCLFPVGKNSMHRWLALKDAAGSFIVEYIRGDPHLLAGAQADGIDHISTMEYWSLKTASPQATAIIILSYNETSSGGVTDLSTLRVAGSVNNGLWINAGNAAVTGSAGSAGSVQSDLYKMPETEEYFTLASSTPVQNPLPLKLISFTAFRRKDHVSLKWETGKGIADHFDIERSEDGLLFKPIKYLPGNKNIGDYSYNDPIADSGRQYYRLKITERNVPSFYSPVVQVGRSESDFRLISLNIMDERLVCMVGSEMQRTCRVDVFDMAGRKLMVVYKDISPGSNPIYLDVPWLPAGVYVMRLSDRGNKIIVRQFIKN